MPDLIIAAGTHGRRSSALRLLTAWRAIPIQDDDLPILDNLTRTTSQLARTAASAHLWEEAEELANGLPDGQRGELFAELAFTANSVDSVRGRRWLAYSFLDGATPRALAAATTIDPATGPTAIGYLVTLATGALPTL